MIGERKMNTKWYGKIGYDQEGIVNYIETDSKSEAEAFVKGFIKAQEQTADADEDPLEDYWTVVDQLEPVEV